MHSIEYSSDFDTRPFLQDGALSPTYVSKGENAENPSPYDLAAMQAVLAGGEMETNGSPQLQVEVEEMEVDVQEDPLQSEVMDMLVEDPGELVRCLPGV